MVMTQEEASHLVGMVEPLPVKQTEALYFVGKGTGCGEQALGGGEAYDRHRLAYAQRFTVLTAAFHAPYGPYGVSVHAIRPLFWDSGQLC